ncbi:NADP-dependent isocitrate dehydrogenase [Anaerobacillus isosaccharinicus]|uniref:Isocitrate dehydrogenase [NADP] n=1 Tax=Anaerobacillus isosaccharinicus TaxID=1532552 RepID=A0A1S2LN34_9BACI|nr:NADP-dependent isocitrate dehydrogenase [Anaerobacillus isosaccharinicus]MBA5586218.1 NADP-dependent isocitrate dehydrogenase [Anaerobacillus isosaccharinicus]QOY35524.1 NADP-dependent isocitrate dehydrogenase [Anaerobacillus isosaccharinicus]
MTQKRAITIARGDGIGPEIMEATLKILDHAGAMIEPEFIDIGEKVYLTGNTTGIPDEAWESLRRTKVFLKSPITTPQGGGYKSLNVTIRKTLGLFANVRPNVSYAPFVKTKHPNMNMVIIRENEEDLYAGIEHQQTPEVVQCLKLITRPGSEKIIRYAFEYAKRNNRKKVTCLTKDNIMKLSDGLFHKVFKEVAKEYPEIEADHWIIDIGMAKVADTPQDFDVVVTLNLYGDIVSDVAAQVAGSVGLAGSANIGDNIAMFEAIHGSAPDIAAKGIANPSGLIHGAIMMLVHIGQPQVAARIHNAWLKTLEDEIYTGDIAKGRPSVGTAQFAQAVIERLGQTPTTFQPVQYENVEQSEDTQFRLAPSVTDRPKSDVVRQLDGVDVFLFNNEQTAELIGQKLETLAGPEFNLAVITNRGVKVYPNGFPETFTTDHWRCRFQLNETEGSGTNDAIINLLTRIQKAGLDFIKTENLYKFDGELGYSLGQGQ